ncbi:hypothetical protein [Nibricoccus sp. IMCC34717]|uniref:hypothetical protein n=1 Tax=Nibricoccus sp. IMCC34717 TaxID=3034021 RepID=UPI00384E839D
MITSQKPALLLDADSIDPSELSIPALMRELNLQQKPSWLLRKLMNHLESKRQARGLGWSRPWNKVGLTVFRTHRQDPAQDSEYLTPFLHWLSPLLDSADPELRVFAHELAGDPALMAFTFYHNRIEKGVEYEGLTLSLGRKTPDDPTKRDRIDLILEDKRRDGRVDGNVDLARLYVCPWSHYREDRRHLRIDWAPPAGAQQECFDSLYRHAIEHYHQWKSEESRQWGHWASNYIDYFGPRTFIPHGTSFF